VVGTIAATLAATGVVREEPMRSSNGQEPSPVCAVASGCLLGESPIWDAAAGLLYWVDIECRRLHRLEPKTGATASWELPEQPGAVAPRASGGLIMVLEHGLAAFDPEHGRLEWMVDPEPEYPHNRFNDGKCDRQGRFWAGSMHATEPKRATGNVYRFDHDGGVHRVIAGVGIPNTFAWSPDGATMYLASTLEQVIYAFDYDTVTGAIGNRRVFATTQGDDAMPDGSTVDAEGFLWNAQWDGWRVVRYAPDGSVDRIVAMPVQRPTSCMFGGDDLSTLYVTSARTGLSRRRMRPQPLAGGIFSVQAGVSGLPEAPFGG
jgi:sugar lactone lactonase YvrE